jgi:pyruvate/2-oxoglutarate dehydrogenase complex dihydrolipoamide dehydrogenase (E3) component
MARVVVRNALFFGGRRVSRLLIPSCTFTFPEVAHVGMSPGELSSSAMCITIALDDVDRSVVDEEAEGFLKIWHVSGRIVAAAAVAPHAGDIIGHVASVMRTGGRLADLSDTIFPYPTISESLRKAGDAYQRTRLTPAVASMLAGYFKLVRRL